MKVIIKEPNRAPIEADIRNELKTLQKLVDGYIEVVRLASDVVVICNEEALIGDYKFNCKLAGVHFFGTIVIAGVDGEEFCDLPISFETACSMLWGMRE